VYTHLPEAGNGLQKPETGSGMTVNNGIPGPNPNFSRKAGYAIIYVRNEMEVEEFCAWHGSSSRFF